jgi:adenosylcobalamin phosphodiesterase
MSKLESHEDYSLLPKSYKGLYPFRICAPSFIYPASWAENVQLLAPYLDEIELLFFESQFPDSFPSSSEIDALQRLSEDHAVTYNIHLPTDISIGTADRVQQENAIDALKKAFELAAPLNSTTYTLHLPFEEASPDKSSIEAWQGRINLQLEKILSFGIPPEKISIETLDYPFEWVADIVADLNLKICMDMGHLMVHGRNISDLYQKDKYQIDIIHLHGVQNQKDHLALSTITIPQNKAVLEILSTFNQTVSIEVFNYEDLTTSLNWLVSVFRSFKLRAR